MANLFWLGPIGGQAEHSLNLRSKPANLIAVTIQTGKCSLGFLAIGSPCQMGLVL